MDVCSDSVVGTVLSVKLNGETTVGAYKMKWRNTEPRPIGFQDHNTPLWFRNIFIKPLRGQSTQNGSGTRQR